MQGKVHGVHFIPAHEDIAIATSLLVSPICLINHIMHFHCSLKI